MLSLYAMEFKDFKKEYELKAAKFSLPKFKELEEDFEIRRIESEDLILRSVRKIMMDKIVNTLGFLEMLLNPMNAPRMYHAFLNSLTVSDTKRIEEMYGRLGELSILSLEREIDYDEKSEAEMIKKIIKVWNGVKGDFREILGKMKKPSQVNDKKERSYFG